MSFNYIAGPAPERIIIIIRNTVASHCFLVLGAGFVPRRRGSLFEKRKSPVAFRLSSTGCLKSTRDVNDGGGDGEARRDVKYTDAREPTENPAHR